MSYKNRKNEYEKLKKMGREIPQNLKEEFETQKEEVKEEVEVKEVKKKGK